MFSFNDFCTSLQAVPINLEGVICDLKTHVKCLALLCKCAPKPVSHVHLNGLQMFLIGEMCENKFPPHQLDILEDIFHLNYMFDILVGDANVAMNLQEP